MQRKVVQHGPSTLTISLPSTWTHEFNIKKGDDITIEQTKEGLTLRSGKERHFGQKRIDVKNIPALIVKAIAALYKSGYDEIIVEYEGAAELEKIHTMIDTGYIGFEIVDETKEEVRIKKISEPTEEEFKAMFRRIFHFLRSIADEGLEAAQKHDTNMYQKLVLRDENINKLTDLCRRLINKQNQKEYQSDTALYHLVEQLEKIGDLYKTLNQQFLRMKGKPSKKTLAIYEQVNQLLRLYDDLFFAFSMQKANAFVIHYNAFAENNANTENQPDNQVVYLLESIARELYNLIGVTMILHL